MTLRKTKLYLIKMSVCILVGLFVFHITKANDANELQEIVVTGLVTDANGGALPGVTILVEGTTTGTSTDANGKYSIAMPGQESVLVFSYVGFQPQQITVGDQSVINMQMIEDVTQLNEVVVTALGINREKKALGYAVTEVNGEDI